MCSPFEGDDIPQRCEQVQTWRSKEYIWLDQHGNIFQSLADKEASFWNLRTGHSARMKFLIDALNGDRKKQDKLMMIRGPKGQSFLDAFIEAAAWHRVEADTRVSAFWTQYVQVLCILQDLRVPRKANWGRLWREEGGLGFPSPMCWDGVVGLAVAVEPCCFNPLSWGAHDFLANANGDPNEHHAFYIHLAICALDWELEAPHLRMLDRYRKLGGSTRMSLVKIHELLPQIIRECVSTHQITHNLRGDLEKQEEVIVRKTGALTLLLEGWQKSEALWSWFIRRTLIAKSVPKPCVELVDSFLLGYPAMPEESATLVVRLGGGCDPDRNREGVDDVIQVVFHVDPPTRIGSLEAAMIADEQHASLIEHQIGASSAPEATNANEQESIFLVQFKRCPKDLLVALSQGLPLQACRQALEEAGHMWNLPNGDMIFIQPWQYRGVMNVLMPQRNSFSVIVGESFEYLVEECIASIGKGAVAKQRVAIHPQYLATDVADGDVEELATMMHADQDAEPQVFRTFLHFAPRHLVSSESVTQSSTEAHDGGMNPRRVCLECISQ